MSEKAPSKKTSTKASLGERLAKVSADIPALHKDGKNEHFNYNYLSDAQIISTVKPLLHKHGVGILVSSHIRDGVSLGTQFLTNVECTVTFYSIDNPEDKVEMTAVGQGTDKSDKGVYKAITGAIKYCFVKNFLIPTEDDPEKEMTPKKSAPKSHLEDNDIPFD